MKAFLTPGIALLLLAALLHTGILAPSVPFASYAFSGACIAGLLFSWRFHANRTVGALIVLWMAQQAIFYFAQPHAAADVRFAVLESIGILLPIDFVLLSLLPEKGLAWSKLATGAAALFLESVLVAIICRPASVNGAQKIAHHSHATVGMPLASQLCFAGAAIVFLIRFAAYRKPVDSGILWALAGSFLALYSGGTGRIPAAYFAASACILAFAAVEASYLLAYHDELTTLPSRRAFNEALPQLQAPYCIAMVDIDRFKRCNDTHGHDVGDQVLRLVASKLGRVSGRGQAFRCGGEEFAILFPGRSLAEVLDCLEELRATIEDSTLRLRGGDRRQQPRGPDRRKFTTQARMAKGQAIRKLSNATNANAIEISVTVSIGVAAATHEKNAEEIMKAADTALYRAKNAGRNRIEVGSGPRHARAKTAGIA